MQRTVKRVRKGLQGAVGWLRHGYPFRFDYTKKELLDVAFTQLSPPPGSFADLGGVWGIDGAYCFYLMSRYPVGRAFLLDTDVTETVREKSKQFPKLIVFEGDFADPSLAASIGHVDAVVLFDVLLHQVQPDWDEILKLYAPRTKSFIIYNQQFIASDTTVRLPDLGREKYFEHVPLDPEAPGYRNLFERPEEIHPRYKKRYRDVHNVWQWGITDGDLMAVMERLGYGIVFRRNFGQFSHFRSFENHAFIFVNESS